MRLTYLLFILLLFSCGDAQQECPMGKPQAIFKLEHPQVEGHQFSSTGQNSTEEIQFVDGVRMEIYQGGCEQIEQEYRFVLPSGDCPSDGAFWVRQAVREMHRLGDRGESYLQYHQWANAIEEAGQGAALGTPFRLVESFFAKVERVCSGGERVLIVVLSQEG